MSINIITLKRVICVFVSEHNLTGDVVYPVLLMVLTSVFISRGRWIPGINRNRNLLRLSAKL